MVAAKGRGRDRRWRDQRRKEVGIREWWLAVVDRQQKREGKSWVAARC